MNASNPPQDEPVETGNATSTRAAGTPPAAGAATSQVLGAKVPSSSPNRSAYPVYTPWPARMPLSLEQIVFLTLVVLIFTTAVVAFQVVLVATVLISRLW